MREDQEVRVAGLKPEGAYAKHISWREASN